MSTTRIAIAVVAAWWAGGCAAVSPAREAQCATLCARALPEMSLSKDDGEGLCRCWAMGDPERVTPSAIASIRYPVPARVAGR